ncbi:hypothetical protein [Micromonospora peucetia]|uniref:Uncharacterized protein n=1 Tax=Micromonospora peucetia TaxID=47871 RepID=A0ABZ1EK02_9ACTN|nr:hypothetical protein [Micromonospora peucetia]WSA34573.1 hypothetical protein OIE14_11265 [Micromonospora peucetia]
MIAPKLTAEQLADRLAEERALITVQRDDLRARRRLDAEHRDALAEVEELTTSRRRARRERDRDEVEDVALAELYRHAARSGARARIRTDIQRSAEMRALRIARVRTATLWVGVPVLAAFGLWSTAGVQAGVVRLLGLDHGTAGWWAAWAMEPALLTIVAAIIVGRAVLRSSGGDTDSRATAAEWVALTTSIVLNVAGGWVVGGGWGVVAGLLAHSVGPLGAAGTAWLIGLFDSYVTRAKPWKDAPRLAELDLSPPTAGRGLAGPAPASGPAGGLEALVEATAPTTAEVVEQEVARQIAAIPAPTAPATPRPRWRPDVAPRSRRIATPRTPEVTVVVAEPATPAATRPARRWHSPTTVRSRHLRDTMSRRMSPGRGDIGGDTTRRRVSPPKPPAGDTGRDTVTRRVSRPKPAAKATTTAERVAAAVAKNPAVKADALAKKFGVSTRTIQRAWPKQPATVNGHDHSREQ